MSKWITIGKTQFNRDNIKRLSLTKFKKAYGSRFGKNTEEVYYRITGKKKTKKEAE